MTYILYSEVLDKYYVGHTSQPMGERLSRHLSSHKGFTARAKDWIVVYTRIYGDKQLSLQEEKRIQKRGAKRFILDQD